MDYDLIVVGAGMFGSACARHAAEGGARVALIGPPEPEGAWDGPFGSHYDEGRITRRLDPDPDWALIADRALGRYGDLQRRSGHAFHQRCGVLIIGPEIPDNSHFGEIITNTRATCAKLGLEVQELDRPALQDRFAQFDYEEGFVGLFEAGDAGVINPRTMVAAQMALVRQAGADVIAQPAQAIHEIPGGQRVTCADGHTLSAPKVVVAAGAYSQISGLVPDMKSTVIRRTVTLFEIGPQEAERLANTPSLVFAPRNRDCEPYLLPPLIYPDGKLWLKIGGEPGLPTLDSEAEAREWFLAGGSRETMEFQTRMIEGLMPGLRYESRRTLACAYTKTKTVRPIVTEVAPGLVACFGGNGFGAKGSDEIGRIGACLALDGAIPDGYEGDFTAQGST